MRVSKFSLAAIALGITALGLSGNGQVQTQAAVAHKPAVHYVKPGAALSLSHDYDGKTDAGEIEAIRVTLTHPYEDGYLSLAILDNPDLELLSSTAPTAYRLSAVETVAKDITLRARKDGTYYINFHAVYEDLLGNISRRSFAIAINTGERPQATKRDGSENSQKPHDGKTLILMPAKETIRTQ